MNNDPQTCGGEVDEHDLPVAPRTQSVILPTTTVEELKQMPLADVLPALVTTPIKTTAREYGPKGNVFFRAMHFEGVGAKVSGHAHNYDHVTYLRKGAVNVLAWNIDPKTGERIGAPVEYNYKAPAAILIKAEMAHELTALEDDTQADCVYAIRDAGTGEVIDAWDGSLIPYQ